MAANRVIQTNQNIEEKFVIAKSGLNYRKKPKGEVMGKFEYSEKLQIIEHSNVFERINDNDEIKKGEWLGVKVNNDTAYVFSAYLSDEKGDDLTAAPRKGETIEEAKKPQNIQNPIEILLPATYRDWEDSNPADILNESWVELNQKEDKYFIKEANYTIEIGEDECSGSATKTILPKNNARLFIKHPNLKIGEIFSIDFDKDKICPKEKVSFSYNGIVSTIRAEGDMLSSGEVYTDKGLGNYCEVENYKLYISTNNKKESLFLEQKSFNDTFVKLLFIGDIDSDEKLDFIFETNRHYEETRVFLYLSSKENESDIIKKVAETASGFDC